MRRIYHLDVMRPNETMEFFLCMTSQIALTFDRLIPFYESLCEGDGGRLPVVLCGDLSEQRQVSTAEGQQLADKYHWPFIETSAKTGENVEEAFMTVVRTYRDHLNLNDNGKNEDDKKDKPMCNIC